MSKSATSNWILNDAQRRAVEHTEGPLMIFAGAGSGKTRVLTYRFAHLVKNQGVHPHNIYAVTFTNKAANEMKQRIFKLINNQSRDLENQTDFKIGNYNKNAPWVSTFHSSCARILRTHAKVLDYTPNFAIYDNSDSLSLMRRVLRECGVNPKELDANTVLHHIDRAKNDYVFPDDFANYFKLRNNLGATIAQLYSRYQAEMLRANAMDFGDLLCNTLTLLKLEKDIAAHYQENFHYIMVDEFQDTNKVQYMLIKLLAAKHRNLCVVGDDDQSIYAFRGASSATFKNFEQDFPNHSEVTLSTNYRSTANIISVANEIIRPNKKRRKKEMKTSNPSGELLRGFCAYNEREEAQYVAREIAALLESGTKGGDIAVFYRINAISRAIEEALQLAGIPYRIFGSHRFYDRKEIKDILAYFRLLNNPSDNEAFLRIVNTPIRGLGDSSVGALISYATSQKKPFLGALREAIDSNAKFLTSPLRKKFSVFLDLISSLKEKADQTAALASPNSLAEIGSRTEALATLLRAIADESTYLPKLKADDSPESTSRIENLMELFNVASEFSRSAILENGGFELQDFVERTSLATDLEEGEQGDGTSQLRDTVSLMSLHLAKGLEFENVFMIGLEEGILPHSRSLYNPDQMEEERRLCYVGVTRAMSRLFLTRAETRQHFASNNRFGGCGSTFLDDIPPALLEDARWGFLSG